MREASSFKLFDTTSTEPGDDLRALRLLRGSNDNHTRARRCAPTTRGQYPGNQVCRSRSRVSTDLALTISAPARRVRAAQVQRVSALGGRRLTKTRRTCAIARSDSRDLSTHPDPPSGATGDDKTSGNPWILGRGGREAGWPSPAGWWGALTAGCHSARAGKRIRLNLPRAVRMKFPTQTGDARPAD